MSGVDAALRRQVGSLSLALACVVASAIPAARAQADERPSSRAMRVFASWLKSAVSTCLAGSESGAGRYAAGVKLLSSSASVMEYPESAWIPQ